MLPISLSEVMCNQAIIDKSYLDQFEKIHWQYNKSEEIKIPAIRKQEKLDQIIMNYFEFGGLPMTFKFSEKNEKLHEISLILERGFELMSVENNTIADKVRSELAELHSKEFTYKNILERCRLRRRETINDIIDDLINHGYLVRKKPLVLGTKKESYLTVFSYIDPGIVSYLRPEISNNLIGTQIEGYVHARLDYLVRNSVFKSELEYFKPFSVDPAGNLRFQSGEIDFILAVLDGISLSAVPFV